MKENKVVYSVSDVNAFISAILTSEEKLKYISVRGEISNFKAYPSGHLYFSLKDDNSVISAVMFANYASKLSFVPKNGDEVTVLASVDAYVPRGSYNLMVFEMNPIGEGQILLELEKLKKKLAAEGLFDESRKRKINIYPKNIGVITAPNGAAIKDIIFNIKNRFPIAQIYVFPSLVQGENAAKELLKAFNEAQNYDLDTLIIGRGGGASEDLSAFNDEALVRAIAKSKMPVISAVGHEIDSTLTDFVADLKVSTPTGAAVAATVDQRELENQFAYAKVVMDKALLGKIESMNEELEYAKDEFSSSFEEYMNDKCEALKHLKEKLNLLNPKGLLKRGYSIVEHNGQIINSINNININDDIVIKLYDGSIISNVKETKGR
ncbi:MAG: exodeoxyribonuclease VII large subunit [Bacilli bacterium]|nr:exodeoxyribonuclease VII large subunit [Bacilli bacterium]